MGFESILQHVEVRQVCFQNVHQLSHSFLLCLQNLKKNENTRISEMYYI